MAKCAAKLQSGRQCGDDAVKGTGRCSRHEHDPIYDWTENEQGGDPARLAEVQKRTLRRQKLARRVLAGKANGLDLARHQYAEACNLCSDIEQQAAAATYGDTTWVRLVVAGYDGVRSASRLVVEAEATLRVGDQEKQSPKLEVVWSDASTSTAGDPATAATAVAAGED